MIVATVAAASELAIAWLTLGLDSISPHQRRVNPVGGQAWRRLSLNA